MSKWVQLTLQCCQIPAVRSNVDNSWWLCTFSVKISVTRFYCKVVNSHDCVILKTTEYAKFTAVNKAFFLSCLCLVLITQYNKETIKNLTPINNKRQFKERSTNLFPAQHINLPSQTEVQYRGHKQIKRDQNNFNTKNKEIKIAT